MSNTNCNCKCHEKSEKTKQRTARREAKKGLAVEGSKEKRKPSAYAEFVRANYSKVRDFPVKERFKKISVMWKEEKAKTSKKS